MEPEDTQAQPELELPETPPEGLRVGLPWERLDPGLSPGGLLQTVRMLLFTPSEAFGMMRIQGPMTGPLLFLVALGTAGTFVGLMWQSWARAMLGAIAEGPFRDLAMANNYGVMSFVVAPFVILILAIISTGVHHLFLLMFGGAPRPVDVTLRVVCYAWGASYIWMIIPACGWPIATIWGAVLTVIGLREAQGVPGGRATAAVVVPYVVAACCWFILSFALATAMMASV